MSRAWTHRWKLYTTDVHLTKSDHTLKNIIGLWDTGTYTLVGNKYTIKNVYNIFRDLWLKNASSFGKWGEEDRRAPPQSPELYLMFCCLRVNTSCSSELPHFCKTPTSRFVLKDLVGAERDAGKRRDWPPAAPSARWSASRCGCLRLRTPPSARLCWGRRVGPRWGSPNIQPPCQANGVQLQRWACCGEEQQHATSFWLTLALTPSWSWLERLDTYFSQKMGEVNTDQAAFRSDERRGWLTVWRSLWNWAKWSPDLGLTRRWGELVGQTAAPRGSSSPAAGSY